MENPVETGIENQSDSLILTKTEQTIDHLLIINKQVHMINSNYYYFPKTLSDSPGFDINKIDIDSNFVALNKNFRLENSDGYLNFIVILETFVENGSIQFLNEMTRKAYLKNIQILKEQIRRGTVHSIINKLDTLHKVTELWFTNEDEKEIAFELFGITLWMVENETTDLYIPETYTSKFTLCFTTCISSYYLGTTMTILCTIAAVTAWTNGVSASVATGCGIFAGGIVIGCGL